MTRYCVIGAGAAGVSALQQLLQAGFNADCYEKTDRVGGHWHTDYDALHLITSRDTTYFENFPMPADYAHFPRRDQVRTYIESYARHHALYEAIRFDTAVASVVPIVTDGPVGSAGWTVTLDTGESIDYDGVLIANGHLWDQNIPRISADFTGRQIHSGSYHNTEDVDGTRVLVVGAGNSGCDLAADAAQHRYEVDIVIRTGTYFQAKSYFGVPRSDIPWLGQFPADEQDMIARLLSRVTLGDWKDYPGMPEPTRDRSEEGSTTVNSLLHYWVQHGRIAIRPGIDHIVGRRVYFSDGTDGEYDTILWATGFKPTLPFLAGELVERRNGVPLRFAGGIIPKGLEKLYYIGLASPRGPQIPVYGEQAKLALRMIALHEAASDGFAGIAAYLSGLQDEMSRIDIVRAVWNEQMADTARLLNAFTTAQSTKHAEAAVV
ncbi:MAG: NAD(P)/FAD-dependent oxidoreductase [Microbacteriaceae bacterium]|nr:MAG: NAD(P)/FAD-dependent oxidoreductase [Microbacteriaceae bacterium]